MYDCLFSAGEKMIHGGDIYRNIIDIDFSVNINPLGACGAIENSLKDFSKFINLYPDYESESLVMKLSRIWNADKKNIVCGNGASELVMATVHSIKPVKALVPIPSFGGYRYALDSEDTQVIYHYLREENDFLLDESFLDCIKNENGLELVIIANPNNPTGRYIDSMLLREIIIGCEKRKINILLDECFMELSDDRDKTVINNLSEWDNVFVLRAFTKSFAIPALRLGYIVGSNEKMIESIKKHLPEWNVSLAAQKAGEAALSDVSYLDEARKKINVERKYLINEFNDLGIKTYPSDTNFILLNTKIPLYENLLERRILIRKCEDFVGLGKDYYRIAVRNHNDNIVLIENIKEINKKEK